LIGPCHRIEHCGKIGLKGCASSPSIGKNIDDVQSIRDGIESHVLRLIDELLPT